MKIIVTSWRPKMDEKKRKELQIRCSEKNVDQCTDIEVNTRAVSNTGITIIISALITAFALTFALTILNYIDEHVEGSYWIQFIITFSLLIVTIFLLLYFQNKKKIWDMEYEKRLQQKLGYKKP